MRIIRVFPRRTSFTPTDELAFIGWPLLMRDIPNDAVIHISCAFTWDIEQGRRLAQAWGQYYPVEIGGPAFGSPVNDFTPGLYVKTGVTFTSRGCPYRCQYCLVPEREGAIREYSEFASGNIIQDNNILACSHAHQERVYGMLREQRHAAVFSGGLSAPLVNDWVASQFKTLRISQLFFACDTNGGLGSLKRARKLLPFLSRDKLRCYVLLGFQGESLADGVKRLRLVWDAGFLPFAQLYQPPEQLVSYDDNWRKIARAWSRPAIIKSIMNSSHHHYEERWLNET